MKRSRTQDTVMTTATGGSRRSNRKQPYARKEKPFSAPSRAVARFPAAGFPNRLTMKHRYCENILLDGSVGALATYNFSCNGLFDPNVTGTGHQPMYFDNCTGVYNHYTVIGSIIRISASFGVGATYNPCAVGIMINDDTTVTPTSAIAIIEQSRTTNKAIVTAPGVPVTVTNKWSAKGSFGGSILGNDLLQGNASGNPTEQQFYTIFAQTIIPSSNAVVCVQVEIEYIAVWDELKDLAVQ